MSTLPEILQSIRQKKKWAYPDLNADKVKAIQDRLDAMGYVDLKLISDNGSNALVIAPTDNQEIVIGLRYGGLSRRHFPIPQVLQAIHSEKVSGYTIEILPRFPQEDINAAIGREKEFEREVQTAYADGGYAIAKDGFFSHIISPAVGGIAVFKYRDSMQRMQSAVMAFDPDVVQKNRDSCTPKCSQGYPTLEDQQRVQQGIIDRDSRLQKLLPNGKALPVLATQVILPPDIGTVRQA